MELSKYLTSTQLLDCTGQVTHTLTLLPSGMVEVVMRSRTVVVDPKRKIVVKPTGVNVADQVFEQASMLAGNPFG